MYYGVVVQQVLSPPFLAELFPLRSSAACYRRCFTNIKLYSQLAQITCTTALYDTMLLRPLRNFPLRSSVFSLLSLLI